MKTAGHLGQTKTLLKLKQHFLWHNMTHDCENYVKASPICNQNKKANIRSKYALESFHTGSPMERLHIDILGPFNTSDSGNNYILMMIDQFTKWVEMAAIP